MEARFKTEMLVSLAKFCLWDLYKLIFKKYYSRIFCYFQHCLILWSNLEIIWIMKNGNIFSIKISPPWVCGIISHCKHYIHFSRCLQRCGLFLFTQYEPASFTFCMLSICTLENLTNIFLDLYSIGFCRKIPCVKDVDFFKLTLLNFHHFFTLPPGLNLIIIFHYYFTMFGQFANFFQSKNYFINFGER